MYGYEKFYNTPNITQLGSGYTKPPLHVYSTPHTADVTVEQTASLPIMQVRIDRAAARSGERQRAHLGRCPQTYHDRFRPPRLHPARKGYYAGSKSKTRITATVFPLLAFSSTVPLSQVQMSPCRAVNVLPSFVTSKEPWEHSQTMGFCIVFLD
jgi:hypothetical protein